MLLGHFRDITLVYEGIQMSALELYVKHARDTKGLVHAEAMQSLRRYIKISRPEDIIKQVEKITDYLLLKTLWEAGLSAEIQEAVLKRSRELIERRRI